MPTPPGTPGDPEGRAGAAAPSALDAARDDLRSGEQRFRLIVETVRDYAIFLLDPEGNVASWNPGAERIKGYRADEIIGQHFSVFYPEEVRATGWPQQELDLARERGRFEDEGWRVRKDGSRFWANVVIAALTHEDGTLRGFAKITRDLTERRRQEERLRQSEERLRLLVEGVQDYAIYMVDPSGIVVSWNVGAQRIKGYSAREVIGRSFERFYQPQDVRAGKPAAALRMAREDGRFEEEGWRVRKDGSLFWAHAIVTPLYDQSGALYGYAKITRDLTERRRVRSLEEQRRQISEFLAMLGHELRNPLAPMRNAVELLRMSSQREESFAWPVDVLDRQLTHVARLVDDLLDVSRITRGKITLRRERLSLRDLVDRAVAASRSTFDERGQTVEVSHADGALPVDGDATRLTQIVMNLLHNASKFTPEGGHAWVRTETDDSMAVVHVRDDGIGIPPDLIVRVFELFAQGERSLDRSEGGLGVGLTLVRRIAEMHGGNATAKSEGPGQGSEFSVRIPLLTEAAPLEPGEPTPRRGAVPAKEARRVLVVDDNRDAAESLAALLRTLGHHAMTAHDGLSAISMVPVFGPDVILLDLGLPRMDGYEVAARLRGSGAPLPAKLVALTGYGQEEDRRRTRSAGFSAHLVKPVQLDDLRRVVEEPEATSESAGGAAR